MSSFGILVVDHILATVGFHMVFTEESLIEFFCTLDFILEVYHSLFLQSSFHYGTSVLAQIEATIWMSWYFCSVFTIYYPKK